MQRLLAVCLAYSLPLGAQEVAPGNETILAGELRADLFFVASDEMQGRLTETPENEIMSAFIRSRFERLGLEPMGPEGSFYQNFRLMKSVLANSLENDLEIVRDDGATMRAQLGDSFFPLRFSASGSVEAEVVFAGYGIRAPKLSHDDYGNGSLRGKIVLVLDHEPGERDPESIFNGGGDLGVLTQSEKGSLRSNRGRGRHFVRQRCAQPSGRIELLESRGAHVARSAAAGAALPAGTLGGARPNTGDADLADTRGRHRGHHRSDASRARTGIRDQGRGRANSRPVASGAHHRKRRAPRRGQSQRRGRDRGIGP